MLSTLKFLFLKGARLWDLIVLIPDHCLSIYSITELKSFERCTVMKVRPTDEIRQGIVL